MKFYKKGDIEITQNKDLLTVITINNNNKHPGFYTLVPVEKNNTYVIKVIGYKKSNGIIKLWICDDNNKVIHYSSKHILKIELTNLEFKYSSNKTEVLKVGFLCSNCIEGDTINIDKFEIITKNKKVTDSKININSSPIYLTLDYTNLNKIYTLEKGNRYIINNNVNFFKSIDILNLFTSKYVSYIIQGNNTKEFIFFINANNSIEINLNTLIRKSIIVNLKIGYTNISLTVDELTNFYLLLGKNSINYELFGLTIFYDNYISAALKEFKEHTRKYNKLTMIICYSYYLGISQNKNYKNEINKLLANSQNFNSKKCLLVGKTIVGYGGVQKTSRQLIESLDYDYEVSVLSKINVTEESQYICDTIANHLIIKEKTYNGFITHINSNNYEFIMNNKLNEFFNIIDEINKPVPIHVITHNSMDSFNKLILENMKSISNVYTINNYHRNLLRYNGLTNNIYLYNNYICNKEKRKVSYRDKFKNKICFVGRLAKEKNIQLLIDAFKQFSNKNTDVKLFIIGDGKLKINTDCKNICLTGRLNYEQIIEHLLDSDYLILPSYTEGLPFCIIEAMNIGIPCIYSNINGSTEVIVDNKSGFLFNLEGYSEVRNNINWDVYDSVDKFYDTNTKRLSSCLERAYSVNINQWNKLSENSYNFCRNRFKKEVSLKKNLLSLTKPDCENKSLTKYKVFINFKPDNNIPYGGGNISTYYLFKDLSSILSDFKVVFELEEDIDIYLVIDPFKGPFKKYSLEEIIDHKNINKTGKIIIRVNDCDKTRIVADKSKSREYAIINNLKNIDLLVFNSDFIKDYYFEQIRMQGLEPIQHKIIYNGCDQNTFKMNINKQLKLELKETKIKIVTHHWSNNMNKGYQLYFDLWKFCEKSDKYEFVFIGKTVPDMFKTAPVIGPFVGNKLSDELNNCHIYITDSKYDSCPNHVLEAISCGLPILYTSCEGGGRNLCENTKYTVGESYNNFEDMLNKLQKITNNYEYYVNNIKLSRESFNIDYCISDYYNLFLECMNSPYEKVELENRNNIITVDNTNTRDAPKYIILNKELIKLADGINVFALSNDYKNIKKSNHTNITVEEFTKNNSKLDNDKINILLCSDKNYFVGMFAVLQSVISNTYNLDAVHFNFMIPIDSYKNVTNMVLKLEEINKVKLSKTVIYLDANILDRVIFESKCYNGGGHLLNIGNFSRLLIGEFMQYDKLIYLDSDSIVQNDICERLNLYELKHDIYSMCANKINTNKQMEIVIKMQSIINCNHDFTNIINTNIDKDDYVFMGAPFMTNCKKWNSVYRTILKIIHCHNEIEGGLYKLFTMSIQNILFYKKSGDINDIIKVRPDLGSKRKQWDKTTLLTTDILDWSGMYKPWFKNGLYRDIWLKYDKLNLSNNFGEICSTKETVEMFETSNSNSSTSLFLSKTYLKLSDNEFDLAEKYVSSIINNKKSDIKLKVLYVIDVNYLILKMSRVRFWIVETLGNREDVKLYITGPGFLNYNTDKTIQDNIISMKVDFDTVLWYKPLDPIFKFDSSIQMPFNTCLRYNEMWDLEWTQKEIDTSNSNIIICHHKNDYEKYKEIYKDSNTKSFYYIPHQANSNIFKPLDIQKDIDILISGRTKPNHYPLKHRLFNILMKYKDTVFKKYKIHHHVHPGYNSNSNFLNKNQIDYNKLINRSKLCIACTSKHKYRLGKYVEIPMSGSIICGDLPYEDERFKNFVVGVDMSMSDKEIIKVIIDTLDDEKDNLQNRIKIGLEWAKEYTTDKYVNELVNVITTIKNKQNKKIFIISDEIKSNHPEFKNQKWICDLLKEEFINQFPNQTTNNPREADIIWYLAPWNHRFIPNSLKINEWYELLEEKHVVFTQHHIDKPKLENGDLNKQFDFMKKYGNKFHSICQLTYDEMIKHFDINKSYIEHLWINNNIFYEMTKEEKTSIRHKYNFSENAFLIGSFQKDTEGCSSNINPIPKLSKGPDIFIKVVTDMYKTNKSIEIVLTGLRREYVIKELEKEGIKYHYFNMLPLEEINKLYNCLDLYLVSSRYEGGPRSIVEAGLTKTPIISTRVGIAGEFMAEESLYDMDNWETYKSAKLNVDILYNKVGRLTSSEHMDRFRDGLLE